MKPHRWPLLALLGWSLMTQPAFAAPHPTRLIALGASDVVGVGDPAHEGWGPVLARLLPGRVTLMRLGISGGLAGQLRSELLPRAVKAKPDLVVLFTGVNDCVSGVPLEQFAAHLDALLAGLAGTGARVYVLGFPDVVRLPAVRPYAAMLSGVVPRWQAVVRETAARHGAHLVDLAAYSAELATHPDYMSADGYHPSARGYRRIAEAIAAAIASRT